jgi:hypothetical protein
MAKQNARNEVAGRQKKNVKYNKIELNGRSLE